jgi:tetratricopeptide (TPR) repeat protein
MSTVNPLDQLRRRIGSGSAPVAFAALAEEHRRAGRLDEAVAVCRDGLQRYPAYVSARVTLGRALLDLGSVREAVLELEAAVEQSPDNLAAARVLADARTRLADLPAADVEEITEPVTDAEVRGVGQEATDYGDVTAAFQDVDAGEIADHAGLWPIPMAAETAAAAVVGEWHEPSAEPTVTDDQAATSWDDETIYAPVVGAATSSEGLDPDFADGGGALESGAAEDLAVADATADTEVPVVSQDGLWESVETSEAHAPVSARDSDGASGWEGSHPAPPPRDPNAWGDVEAGLDQWGNESSASPWFADEALPEVSQADSTAEDAAAAAEGAETQTMREAPAADGEAAPLDAPAPGLMDRPPVSPQAPGDTPVDDEDEADVPSALPSVPVSAEAPSTVPSPWASLLEAAVDEVFADAATPHLRADDPPTAADHPASAPAVASEYDDATVQTLQRLLAAVRARRAELGLPR